MNEVGIRIASDTADSLNRWAAETLDETTPEPRRREEARSYAWPITVGALVYRWRKG